MPSQQLYAAHVPIYSKDMAKGPYNGQATDGKMMKNFATAASNMRGTLFYAAAGTAGELESRIYGIVHILVWAIGLILSAVVAFAAHGTLVDVVDTNGTTPYVYNSTSEMDVVGVSGFVTTLLGVCATLFVGGCVLKNEIRTMPWILYLIFFCTLYGLMAMVALLSVAGANADHWYFWISLFTVIFLAFGNTILYSVVSAMKVPMHVRAVLYSLVSALSVLTAIFVWAYSEDWTVHAHEFGTPMGGFSDSQKFLALGLAIAWPIISVLVFLLRSFYRIEVHHVSGSINAGTGAAKKALTFVSNFDQQPMTRSLILILVLAAFATSTYLQSILEGGNSLAFLYARFTMLVNFLVLVMTFTGYSADVEEAEGALAAADSSLDEVRVADGGAPLYEKM